VTGQRTEKILEAVDRAAIQFRRRIPTAILNEVVQEAVNWLAPPTIGSRSGSSHAIYMTSVTQLKSCDAICLQSYDVF
jgi:GTP-binding protein